MKDSFAVSSWIFNLRHAV